MQATTLNPNAIAASPAPIPPMVGCSTCTQKPALPPSLQQQQQNVDIKAQPPTSLVGTPADLRSTQSRSLLARADAQIKTISNRADTQQLYNRNAALDAKHKDLMDKLQHHQSSVTKDTGKRSLTMKDVKETVNASLKTTQIAEKYKRHPSLLEKEKEKTATVAPTVPLHPRRFGEKQQNEKQQSGNNALQLQSGHASASAALAAFTSAINPPSASTSDKSKMDLKAYREQSTQIMNGILNNQKDVDAQKTNFQSRLIDVQQKGTEDVKRAVASFQQGMAQLGDMKGAIDALTGRIRDSVDNGNKTTQALSMVTDVVQSVQNVTSDPAQLSARIQRSPLRCIDDPILSQWYMDVEEQQKRNTAKTIIVREDVWWLNDKKKKRADLEWCDLIVVPQAKPDDPCYIFVVGHAYKADIQTQGLIVGKLRYFTHTATFELDTKWNSGKLKHDILPGCTHASQLLLYSAPQEFINSVLLILATTEVNERKTACLIALDGVTGDPVSDFFQEDGNQPSSVLALKTDSQLYEGSHGIRMSLDPSTNDLLLLCAVQKKHSDGPQLQTIVARLNEHRQFVSTAKHSPPLVQFDQLSNLFHKFTFIGKDIAWVPNDKGRRFIVSGRVSYPAAPIEECHGFLAMFDDMGNPIVPPLQLDTENNDETASVTSSVVTQESREIKDTKEISLRETKETPPRDAKETPSREAKETPSQNKEISSAPSTPSASLAKHKSSDGFYITMDGSAGSNSSSTSSSLLSFGTKELSEGGGMSLMGGSLTLKAGSLSVTNTETKQKDIVERYVEDEKRAASRPSTGQQFHSLTVIRPTHLRPLVPKPKGGIDSNTNGGLGGLQLLGSGYVGHGVHIIEFANVPNLVIQRVQWNAQQNTILFLGTAMPTPNNAKHAFPFVGCIDINNEKPFNISVLPSSTHQQTSVIAKEFSVGPGTDVYVVGQSLRDPTDADTSEISLIRIQMSKLNIHESCNFRLRGDFHQCLSSIKYASHLNAMIAVGSSQTRVLKAERKGVITLTNVL